MKRFILDTNILIKDPSILSRWNSTYKILIPDIILKEAGKVAGRIRGAENILHKIDEATSKGFLKIISTDTSKFEYSDNLSNRRISFVDFQIAQFAKEYSKEKSDVYLVSEDRVLLQYADEIGVNTLNLFELQNIIRSVKTVDLKDLEGFKSIKSYQRIHLVVSFVSGIGLSVLTILVYRNYESILSTVPVWGSIAFVFFTPFIFYWFRAKWRISYAITEFIIGSIICYSGVRPLFDNFEIGSFSELSLAIPVIGGIYIMVRGLDNFSAGIQGTSLEYKWDKIFGRN